MTNFFSKLFASAVLGLQSLFGKSGEVETIEHKISLFGNEVINEYKKLQGNPTVVLAADFFVKIAEGIDPALVPFIAGIELAFPGIINVATGTLGEIVKPIPEQLGDALTKLQTVQGISHTTYAGMLGAANATIQNYVLSNNAVDLNSQATDSELLVAAHVIHDQN